MHPIEHLRYVARAESVDADVLVEEAAHGLAGLHNNRRELVTSCRRLLAQQPKVGALWDLLARMATGADPQTEALEMLEVVRNDRSAARLVASLPEDAKVALVPGSNSLVMSFGRRGDVTVRVFDFEGGGRSAERHLDRLDVDAEAIDPGRVFGAVESADVVVVEALSVGPDRALVEPGGGVAAALAVACERPLWLVVPARSVMRAEYWEAQQVLVEGHHQGERGRSEYLALSTVDRMAFGDALIAADELPPSDQPLAPELLAGSQ